jgi:hypothetical protein
LISPAVNALLISMVPISGSRWSALAIHMQMAGTEPPGPRTEFSRVPDPQEEPDSRVLEPGIGESCAYPSKKSPNFEETV